MPEDRSWINMGRNSAEFKEGLEGFMEKAKLYVNEEGETRCPCTSCLNGRWYHPSIVDMHLKLRGFQKSYKVWFYHGEEKQSTNAHTSTDDEMLTVLNDIAGPWNRSGNHDGDIDINGQTFTESEGTFDDLFSEVEQELYPGCTQFSVLTFLVKLMHIKTMNQMTNKALDMLLQLLKEAYPETRIPTSCYEVKKKLRGLGLGYEKIDACRYDCALFWKENADLNKCPKCREPRYKDNGGKGKKVAYKVLRYFPITPRLQRLYRSRHTSEDMQWHYLKRPLVDGVLRHPADGAAWKDLDCQYPSFASEPRNVRLGLASDGFNPFGNMSTQYSLWPVILVPYNLPPWKCMKETYFMLSLLIPGDKAPGKDIDIYLRPLVDELKSLWSYGAETIDVRDGNRFTLRAAILWTINDFPAYGTLSGWSTKGYMACPTCNKDTCSQPIRKGPCYMGHRRFLPDDHKYRKMKQFNGKYEYGHAPKILDGEEILGQLDGLISRQPGKHPSNKDKNLKRAREELNWTKKSIFFELEYWSKLKLRHNLDVMHIEKNICDSIYGTLLDIDGKTKDTYKARLDLFDMKIRKELHLQDEGNRVLKPHASYTLTKEERKVFCAWLKSVRFPDGYASNISKNVNEVDGKISGLKTHDCHILLQRLLPVGIRPFLNKNECSTLIELSQFFQKLCSKTLYVSDLEVLQKEIVVIICKLERIFPPAFFDVMVHLAIHLPYEAILGGPVHTRWMYPFERALRTYKSYVRNKAHPEGSIAEAYIVNEALTFCSMYLRGIETRFNHQDRNNSASNQNLQERDLLIFQDYCRPLGKETILIPTSGHLKKAHWYVLNNCPEVEPYLEQHKKELELAGAQNLDQLQEENFPDWFKTHMSKLHHEGSPEATEELYALANRPDPRFRYYPGCVVNGVKFLIKERDDKRKTQNCGLCVQSTHEGHEMDFYGVLLKVFEMRYIKGCRVTLFECKWFDINPRRKRIEKEYNIVSINAGSEWYKTEPFILATQAQQVYYLDDIKGRSSWKSVYKVNHRHLWDVPARENNVDVNQNRVFFEENVSEESVSSDIHFTCEQPDMETLSLLRNNGDPEIAHIDSLEREMRVRSEDDDDFSCDDDDGDEDEELEDYNNGEKLLSDEDMDVCEQRVEQDCDDSD